MSTRRPHTREHGFTIIEIVVACVLLAIVLALAARPIIDGFSGAATTQSDAKSSQLVAEAQAAIRDDVTRAFAPGRDPTVLRSVEKLELAIDAGVGDISSDDGMDTPLDIRDVVVATPSELVLRIPSGDASQLECVRWRATVTSGRFRLVRSSQPQATRFGLSCVIPSPAARESTVIDAAASAPPDVTNEIFAYRVLTPGAGATCDSATLPTVPTIPGGAGPVPNVNRIVALDVAISASQQRASSGGSASAAATTSLRGRETPTYRTAMGCP